MVWRSVRRSIGPSKRSQDPGICLDTNQTKTVTGIPIQCLGESLLVCEKELHHLAQLSQDLACQCSAGPRLSAKSRSNLYRSCREHEVHIGRMVQKSTDKRHPTPQGHG